MPLPKKIESLDLYRIKTTLTLKPGDKVITVTKIGGCRLKTRVEFVCILPDQILYKTTCGSFFKPSELRKLIKRTTTDDK